MPRTFHEFATSGSSIAHAQFDARDLEEAIDALRQRFGLNVGVPDGFFEKLRTGLRFAAGAHWHESYAVERPAIARRLHKVRTSAVHIARALAAMDTGLQDN